MREANAGGYGSDEEEEPAVDFAMGFIDEAVWNEMVEFYKKEYVPTYQFRIPKGAEDYWYKDFELEQDLTHDFVKSVRDGTLAAAKENGITDMMWIAVIDAKTDECCTWRHGLSSSEIEDQLKGEHSDDDCEEIVPPAHYYCRCTIAPMVDSMSEAPESNQKEFDEWLNS